MTNSLDSLRGSRSAAIALLVCASGLGGVACGSSPSSSPAVPTAASGATGAAGSGNGAASGSGKGRLEIGAHPCPPRLASDDALISASITARQAVRNAVKPGESLPPEISAAA